MYSVGGLLCLRADFREGRRIQCGPAQRRDQRVPQSVVPHDPRSDIRDRLHVADAADVRSARGEEDVAGRDGSLGAALRALCDGRAERRVLAHRRRNSAARRLLRLLLCDRADLRRQEVDTRGARPGAGIPRARHLWGRDVHWRPDRG